MSERELEKRQVKALLYAIALLHLLFLGLLKEPPAKHAGSRYAIRTVSVEKIG